MNIKRYLQNILENTTFLAGTKKDYSLLNLQHLVDYTS